jgi:hypothetical protein
MNLRDEARGRDCMVRLPCCNGNPATTVLAHYRILPYSGTGFKNDDFVFGAWACSSCHDEIDRRTRVYELDFVKLAHLEGILRTQYQLIKEGKIV